MTRQVRAISLAISVLVCFMGIFSGYAQPALAADALPEPSKASAAFGDSQGTQGWSWQRAANGSYGNGAYEDLGVYANGYWWHDQANNWAMGRIGMGEIFVGYEDYDLAMTYTAESDGVANLTTEGNGIWIYNGYNSNDGAYLAIYKNGLKIWPAQSGDARRLITNDNQISDFGVVTVSVKAGDKLHFRVNKNSNNNDDNIVWNPVVTYTSLVYDPALDPEYEAEVYPSYSFFDDFSDIQGSKGWNYLSSPIGGKVVAEQGGFIADFLGGVWASGKNNWTDGVISKTFIQPGRLADAIIAFKVPVTGNISISVKNGEVALADSRLAEDAGDGAAIGIFKNSAGEISPIWPKSGYQQLANGSRIDFEPISVNVRKNEYIYFRANKGMANNYHDTISFLPIVSYNSVDAADEGVADMPTEGTKDEPTAGADESRLPAVKDFTNAANHGNFDFAGFVSDAANSVDGVVTIPQGIYSITNKPDDERTVFRITGLHDVVIDASGVKLVFTNESRSAIVFENNDNVKLKGLEVAYANEVSPTASIEPVIGIVDSNQVVLENVSLVNRRGTGISVGGGSNDIRLDKLFISSGTSNMDSSDVGVLFHETTARGTVTNSVFIGNQQSAIIDRSTDGSLIENNRFSAQHLNVIKLQSSGAIVKFNTIENAMGSGIVAGEASTVSNILIAKNKISGTGTGTEQESRAAIELNHNENSVVFGNAVANTTSSQAVAVNGGKNITIADNSFSGNTGTPLLLNDVSIALVNDNSGVGSVVRTGETVQVYGNDMPGDPNVTVGADMSRLPQLDKQRFAAMEKRTGVNVDGANVPLQQYITNAYNNGLSSVIIPPGAYTVLEADWSHLTFNRMKDFTVYAYGVFMECEKYTSSAIQIWNSKNITIKGLTIDFKQVANTQGVIVSKNGDEVIWKADEGYPADLTDLALYESNSWAEVFRGGSDRPLYDVGFDEKIKNGDGTILLKAATNLSGQAYPLVQHLDLEVGDKLVFRGKTAHVNYVYESSGVKYEDVTVYNGSGFGFMELNGDGGTQLNRIAFTPGPPPVDGAPERLISTCDATHSTNMRIGIQVRNSLFEKMTDDAANVHSTYGEVSSFDPATKQMKYKGKYVDPVFRQGDRVLVYTLDGKLLGDATAVRNTMDTEDGKIVEIDKTFEWVEGETIVQNASASGAGFLYDNCVVINNRSRGFLLKASNGAIRNSTLDDNGMSAILVKPEISDGWGESGFASGLTIENNVIRNSGYYTGSELHSPINISSDREPTSDRAYLNHKNIIIRNNVFEDRYTKYAINVNGVEGLIIEGNQLGSRLGTYEGFDPVLINAMYPNDNSPSIKLSGVYDVTIAGNTYPTAAAVKVERDATAVNIKGSDLAQGGNGDGSSGSNDGGNGMGSDVNGNGLNGDEAVNISISATTEQATGVSLALLTNEAAAQLIEIVKHAKRVGKKAIAALKIEAATGSNAVELRIPRSVFHEVAAGGSLEMRVETVLGSVVFDAKALESIEAVGAAGDIRIVIAKVTDVNRRVLGDRPAYEFSVFAGERSVSSFGGGKVQISIPYTLKPGEDPNAVVVYFADELGGLNIVRGKFSAVARSVDFMTTHFSQFIIGYNKVEFIDVSASDWFDDAVGFLAARGIATGTKVNHYSPNETISRGQFIVLLLRAYGIQADGKDADNFVDAGNTYYSGYLAAAKRLGIATGVGGNKFAPDSRISRQELFTLLYRALDELGELPKVEGKGDLLAGFSDAEHIAGYAQRAFKVFVDAGVIAGSNGKLDPAGITTRAQAAQVLYNLLGK